MTAGKNKRISKGKKGIKKKLADPFSRKDWYDIKAPAIYSNRQIGKTVVNRTQGTKIASDSLKGRVVEANLADLNKDEDQAFRKLKFRIEEVQGKNVLTDFYGMDVTSDRLKSLLRKNQTLIEAHQDVSTTDGYRLRLFIIAFTQKRKESTKKTAYAQSSQIRAIRRKMFAVMKREAETVELKDLFVKFIPNVIGKQIEKECQGIYPLQNVFVRKVKMLRSPKTDIARLLEIHGDASPAAAAAAVAAAANTAGAPAAGTPTPAAAPAVGTAV